ncbi:hypothetical protein [Ferroplasma sp.]|nr:hypothetical protein [Ferroplasma sp.]
MKSEKSGIPRIFELWYQITGEKLWDDEGPDSHNGGVPNRNKKE